MNRRGFLKGILAGSVSTPVIAGAMPAANGPESLPATSIVIHDARYSDARTFAAAATRLGAIATGPRADLIHLWQQRLGPTLRKHRYRVMGMTTYADFMLLRDCMSTIKYRPVFEGLHDCRGHTVLTHKLRYRGQIKPALIFAGRQWPATLARVLYRDQEAKWPLQESVITSSVQRATDHPGTLVSWMMV